jgi:RNA polymerase sigma-54 factor
MVKLSQNLKQTQNLTITPQLQHAIKLLTLTHLEMTNVIANEMTENPVLEEYEAGEDTNVHSDINNKLKKLERENAEAKSENFSQDKLIDDNQDGFDWDKYTSTHNDRSSTSYKLKKSNSDDQLNYENIVSKSKSLQDHLEWQARMENFTKDEMDFAFEVIHNINDEGYLEVDFKELLKKTNLDQVDAEEILSMIKKLEPAGCGSSDIQECLLAQSICLTPRLTLVEQMIEKGWDAFKKRDYKELSKILNASIDEIKDAERVLSSLHPKPGRIISPEQIHYVVPDIYVEETANGDFTVRLNNEGIPRLQISGTYTKMAKESGKDVNIETKQYVQDKLKDAQWLIKSIENRQKTIFKVSEAIIKYQIDFFKKGPGNLKPMILKDIAREIEMHESTVSRVTTNKYMYTPHGIFELKYFFSNSINSSGMVGDIAVDTVKRKIKKMIDNESPEKPLSDQKIVELLKFDNITIARRTVAKHRDEMNILSSSKRKRFKK